MNKKMSKKEQAVQQFEDALCEILQDCYKPKGGEDEERLYRVRLVERIQLLFCLSSEAKDKQENQKAWVKYQKRLNKVDIITLLKDMVDWQSAVVYKYYSKNNKNLC